MSITSAQLLVLNNTYIGAAGDTDIVARLPAMTGLSASDVANLANGFSGASPQQLVVIVQARALSKGWASMTASSRSADAATYASLSKASPPTTWGSSDLNTWILANA